LGTNVGTEIFPLRIFRVGRRLERIGADVAKAARHGYTIGTDQLLVVVIRGVGVKALGIPFLLRCLVKVGIRKEAQSNNAGAITVVGARGNILAARADF